MLTADLLLYRRHKGRVFPHRIDPASPALLAAAQSLIRLFASVPGKTRGEIEEAASGLAYPDVPLKVQRGLLKLLFDRAEFGTEAAGDPAAIRHGLFDAAAVRWREEGANGPPSWRVAVLNAVAAEQGLTPAQAEAAMFADLPSQQRLLKAPDFTPGQLLLRFNSAQIQGLLLGAQRVVVEGGRQSPQRLRQILRWLKFFGLLFRSATDGAEGLRVGIDGPLAVLEASTRYGLQLAEFFPALLLWPPPWKMRAQVRLRSGGGLHELLVEPDPYLRSHYPDRGQWVPQSARGFVEQVRALGSSWQAEPAEGVLMLADNRYLVPDFLFRHPRRTQTVLVEHLLQPSPEILADRLALARAVESPRYLFACRGTPAMREAAAGAAVFLYKRNLTAAAFVDWLEQVQE